MLRRTNTVIRTTAFQTSRSAARLLLGLDRMQTRVSIGCLAHAVNDVSKVGFALAVISTACTDERAGPAPSSDLLMVATFNAGLAPGDVPYVEERAPLIADELARSSSDFSVLCVQEYWRSDDWNVLKAKLGALSNTIRLPAEPTPVTCTPEELAPLRDCVARQCTGECGDKLGTCALHSCTPEFDPVSASCGSCLTIRVSAGDCLDDAQSNCLVGGGDGGNGGGDGGKSEPYIYGGAYDTGLLLRSKPSEEDSLVLDSYLVRSAVHYARVTTRFGETNVFCAHLASDVPPFKYLGKFGSWEGEHAHQVDQLLDYVAAKAPSGTPAVLLGDLNMGPAIGNLVGELPDDYSKLLAAGFIDPYVSAGSPECTNCPENTLDGASTHRTLIDHILVRNLTGTVERFMTSVIDIDLDGGPTQTNFSDHYGLRGALQK